MSSRLNCIIIIFLSGSVWNDYILAQGIRVQQPTVQQFSTRTTVIVPNGGSAVLGTFNSGGIQSRQVGPFRRGSSYGQTFQSSTSSIGVYIHDFESMDKMLLNSALESSKYRGRNSHYNLTRWKEQLFKRNTETKQSAISRAVPLSLESIQKKNTQTKAERFFKLGQNAEEKHTTPNIAILHYKAAAKYGSTKATQRLEQLSARNKKRTQ